jgi:hypothetical protein
MILGMSLATFTAVHVILSLIGIAAGLVVFWGMLGAQRLPGWTALFLATTVLTSVTGFMFPFKHFGGPHAFGVISLVALPVAILGLYTYKLAGSWRWLYVVCALLSLYLNVFVGVVQAFQRLAPLKRLAPTQSEPPFAVAQLLVLLLFVVFGVRAVKRFHPVTHL